MHDIADTRKKHAQNRSRLYGERYHNIKYFKVDNISYIFFFISSCIIVYFYPIIIIWAKYDCE